MSQPSTLGGPLAAPTPSREAGQGATLSPSPSSLLSATGPGPVLASGPGSYTAATNRLIKRLANFFVADVNERVLKSGTCLRTPAFFMLYHAAGKTRVKCQRPGCENPPRRGRGGNKYCSDECRLVVRKNQLAEAQDTFFVCRRIRELADKALKGAYPDWIKEKRARGKDPFWPVLTLVLLEYRCHLEINPRLMLSDSAPICLLADMLREDKRAAQESAWIHPKPVVSGLQTHGLKDTRGAEIVKR